MKTLSNAKPQDAEKLCEIAVSAFTEDEQHKPEHLSPGGPPGHDNVQKHLMWINRDVYIKYQEDGHIYGGCVACIHGSQGKIDGLFVKASAMNRGVGSSLIHYLMHTFPNVFVWTLKTPDYAKRNHTFYEKHGFECIKISEPEKDLGFGFYWYENKTQKGDKH